MSNLYLSLQIQRGVRDIVLEADDHVSVGDLADAIASELGNAADNRLTIERASRGETQLARDARLSRSDLRSGDVIRLIAADSAGATGRGTSIGQLRVISGPATGQVINLEAGEYVIGRGADCDIRIDDALASRHHAKLAVSDVIEVSDLGSVNGVLVGGQSVGASHRLANGDQFLIGETYFDIQHRELGQGVLAGSLNQVSFNRPPRISEPYRGTEIELPAPPDDPRKQRLPMVAAFAGPLVMGSFMYLLTRSIYSMAFVVMSPVMMLTSYWESKRSGRAEHRQQLTLHTEDVAALSERLEQERQAEVAHRLAAAPPVEDLTDHAASLSARLWEREPDNDDFLELRVGLAPQTAGTVVTVGRGGSRALRPALEELANRYGALPPVPVTVPIGEVGNVGVAGRATASSDMARSLIGQTATLHSPAEVVICALLGDGTGEEWDWLKWIPHTRSPTSPISGPHLAKTVDDSLALLQELGAVVQQRADEAASITAPPAVPHVIVLVDDRLPLERARLTGLLDAGPWVGVSFIWFAELAGRLPKSCGAVIEMADDGSTARVGYELREQSLDGIATEGLKLTEAHILGRVLAPVVDVSSRQSGAAELPRTVGLGDLLGGETILDDPQVVLDRWNESAGTSSLRAPAGAHATGTFSVDLRSDGPHGLVAGTTGAGKSEFLQSLLTGFACTHSPSRITFLLVDYKGGAAFKDVVHLPHTVGLVTDLTPALVRRALQSLRAELHRREQLLNETGSKDLLDMQDKAPQKAPPSLVIVVDEFAALAREVPEFVEGVVDVAQRGRSLGLHLLLATQRPAGVVTDNIRANTNLKISLRVAAEEDSMDVINSPAAALLDRSIPGRGLARLGPSELIPFQSGYVGGRTNPGGNRAQLTISDFGFGPIRPWPKHHDAAPETGPTDLERMVVTLNEAFRQCGEHPPRRPWLAPLHHLYDLRRLPRPESDQHLPIGVADDPAHQWQELAYFHPDHDGSVLIYGSGGSGKTVLLRTLAATAAMADRSTPVHVYGLDFASRGLEMIGPLPQVGGVVMGDDYERLTRLLRDLHSTLEQRGRVFAQHRAGTLTEYRANTGDTSMPRIILLVDGYENFQAAYERIDRGEWLDLANRLAVDGRQVGIHLALTGTRRSSFPSMLTSTVARKIVLRLANDDEYHAIGADSRLVDGDEPAGRAVDGDGVIQVAVLGGDADTPAQAQAFADLGRRLEADEVSAAEPLRILPDEVPRSWIAGRSAAGVLAFGLTEHFHVAAFPTGEPVLIAGPTRSGKTTAIAACVEAAREAGMTPVVISGRRPIHGLTPDVRTAVGPSEAAAMLGELQSMTTPHVLLLDELEDLVDSEADTALTDYLRRDGMSVIAACETSSARRGYSDALKFLKRGTHTLILQPDTDMDSDLAGAPLPRSQRVYGPGRGLLCVNGQLTLIQVALP